MEKKSNKYLPYFFFFLGRGVGMAYLKGPSEAPVLNPALIITIINYLQHNNVI